MRSLTRRLLWLFVFTVPWDVVALPGFGALSRMVGIATLGAALVTTAMEGRFRKPNLIVGLATAYIGFSGLSLLWTISYPNTIQLVKTGVQVLGSVWVIREFARTRDDHQALLVAFCLGELVPLAGVLNSYRSGLAHIYSGRYTAMSFNADDLGLTLVIGIPIAWYLMMSYDGTLRRTVRAVGLLYFAVAPVATLLTGTRGAIIAGVVGLSVVPLTLLQRSLRSFVLVTALLVAVGGAMTVVVPQRMWTRLFSIKSEVLEGGRMTGRSDIWKAGLQVLPDRPLLGVGTGAYGAATMPLLNKWQAPHNLALGVLVEQGMVGFALYTALLVAFAVAIARLPPPERKLWAALMMSWLVGVMSLNWEYRKVTWLLFGLLAAQSPVERVGRRLSSLQRRLTATPFRRRSPDTIFSPSVINQPFVSTSSLTDK